MLDRWFYVNLKLLYLLHCVKIQCYHIFATVLMHFRPVLSKQFGTINGSEASLKLPSVLEETFPQIT